MKSQEWYLVAKIVNVHRFRDSAPPLTAEAASLIEKETPALRSHIRGVTLAPVLVHGNIIGPSRSVSLLHRLPIITFDTFSGRKAAAKSVLCINMGN
jgi:hypothetical protein